MKYTYYGDADLTGAINGADYTLTDGGFGSNGAQSGWVHGDFNYDLLINGSDFTLIDNDYNQQGTHCKCSKCRVAVPRATI